MVTEDRRTSDTVGIGEILLQMKHQNEALTTVSEAVAAIREANESMRQDIHELKFIKNFIEQFFSGQSKVDEMRLKVNTLQTQVDMFRYMMGVFGSVAIIAGSAMGYVIKVTHDRMQIDHDALVTVRSELKQVRKQLDTQTYEDTSSSTATADTTGN